MKFIASLILGLVFASGALAKDYGGKIQLTNKQSLNEIIAQAKAGELKKPILVEATVEKVCEASGCWMTLKGANDSVRITFKDYGFFVPVELVGKKVLVEGEAKVHKMSLKETKHYVKDAGGDPSQVTEPKTEVRIVASAVRSL